MFYILKDQSGLAIRHQNGCYSRSIFKTWREYIRAIPRDCNDGTGCLIFRGISLKVKVKL